MIELDIPGFGKRSLHHLILDFNGTLAIDGRILPGVLSRLSQLRQALAVHVLTADTYGTVRTAFGHGDYTVHVLPTGDERTAKADYVRQLGPMACACMGNGNNDAVMLGEAGLAVAVFQAEGLALAAFSSAHVLVPSIEAGLDLLLHPARLKATLRF